MNDGLTTGREDIEDRLTQFFLLQELTVAALNLFDPLAPLDGFLSRVVSRLGAHAAIMMSTDVDQAPTLIGAAGLSDASQRIPYPPDLDAGSDCLKVYPEFGSEGTVCWSYQTQTVEGRHTTLNLVFTREPTPVRSYRSLASRLFRVIETAMVRRRSSANSLASEHQLRLHNLALRESVADQSTALETANERIDSVMEELHDAHGQLVHTGKLAAVGTLLAGLSHELNNPLGVILGFSQSLLRDTPPDDPRFHALETIEREARRCGRLVKTLLDFSRREPGDQIEIDPLELIDRVCTLAEPRAHQRGVQLHVESIKTPIPIIIGGLTELESAIVNLVANAIDATPQGGQVTLSCRVMARGGRSGVELRVVDSGEGIPSEYLTRIFEPFFTTKPTGKGTGLGLSIARQAVEACQGTLRAASRAGEGTIMTVWLPTARIPIDEENAP